MNFIEKNNSINYFAYVSKLSSNHEYYLDFNKDYKDLDYLTNSKKPGNSNNVTFNNTDDEMKKNKAEFENDGFSQQKNKQAEEANNNNNNFKYKKDKELIVESNKAIKLKNIKEVNYDENIANNKFNEGSHPTGSFYIIKARHSSKMSLNNYNVNLIQQHNNTIKNFKQAKSKHIINKISTNIPILPVNRQLTTNSNLNINSSSNINVKHSHLNSNINNSNLNNETTNISNNKFFTEKDISVLENVCYKSTYEVFQKPTLDFQINKLKLHLNKIKYNNYSNTNLINLLIFLFANKIDIVKSHLFKYYKGINGYQVNCNLLPINEAFNNEGNEKTTNMTFNYHDKKDIEMELLNYYYNLNEELNSHEANIHSNNSKDKDKDKDKDNEIFGIQLFLEGVPTLVLINNQIPVICEKRKNKTSNYFDTTTSTLTGSTNNANYNSSNNLTSTNFNSNTNLNLNNVTNHKSSSFNLNNNNNSPNNKSVKKSSIKNNSQFQITVNNNNINNVNSNNNININNSISNNQPNLPFSDILTIINTYSSAFLNVSEQAYWIILLEKAIAAAKGNYLNSLRMMTSELVLLLTPYPLTSIIHSTTSVDNLFRFLSKSNVGNSIIFAEMNYTLLETYDPLYFTSFFVTSISVINGSRFVELCLPEVASEEIFVSIQQELLSYNDILGNEEDLNTGANSSNNFALMINNNINANAKSHLVGTPKGGIKRGNTYYMSGANSNHLVSNSLFNSPNLANSRDKDKDKDKNSRDNKCSVRKNSSLILSAKKSKQNDTLYQNSKESGNSNKRTIILNFNVYRTLFYKTYLLKPYDNYYYCYKSFRVPITDNEKYILVSLKVLNNSKQANKLNLTNISNLNAQKRDRTDSYLIKSNTNEYKDDDIENIDSNHEKLNLTSEEENDNSDRNNKKANQSNTINMKFKDKDELSKEGKEEPEKVHAIINFGLKHLTTSSGSNLKTANTLNQNLNYQSTNIPILEKNKIKEEYFTRIIILKRIKPTNSTKLNNDQTEKKHNDLTGDFNFKNKEYKYYNEYSNLNKTVKKNDKEVEFDYDTLKISTAYYGNITKYSLEAYLDADSEYLIIIKSINSDFYSQITEVNDFNNYRNVTKNSNNNTKITNNANFRMNSFNQVKDDINPNNANNAFKELVVTCYSSEIITINNALNSDSFEQNNINLNDKFTNANKNLSKNDTNDFKTRINEPFSDLLKRMLRSLARRNQIVKKDTDTINLEIYSLVKEQPKIGYSYYCVKNKSTTNYLYVSLHLKVRGMKLLTHQLTSDNFRSKDSNSQQNQYIDLYERNKEYSESDSSSSIESNYKTSYLNGEFLLLIPPGQEESIIFEWFKGLKDVNLSISPKFNFKNFSPLVKEVREEYVKTFIAKKVSYFEIVFSEGVVVVIINDSMTRSVPLEIEFNELNNLEINRVFDDIFYSQVKEDYNYDKQEYEKMMLEKNKGNSSIKANLTNNTAIKSDDLNKEVQGEILNNYDINIIEERAINNLFGKRKYSELEGNFIGSKSNTFNNERQVSEKDMNRNDDNILKVILNPCSRVFVFLRKINYGKVQFSANFRLLKQESLISNKMQIKELNNN